MAILQSMDGRFYQIPDEDAEKFLVPADKVEETLGAMRAAQPQAAAPAAAGGAPASGPMNAAAPSVIIVVGGGEPQGMPMSGAQQPMAGSGQVQAYGWGHHHHHRPPWWGCYNNYYNYSNYYNHYGW
ncbi:MAG: hypothetical protein HZC54_04630 [Verrucomicrobia bacterium]|nr:hypothetical protein [Verrucomicrobiota bacterium]